MSAAERRIAVVLNHLAAGRNVAPVPTSASEKSDDDVVIVRYASFTDLIVDSLYSLFCLLMSRVPLSRCCKCIMSLLCAIFWDPPLSLLTLAVTMSVCLS